LGGLVLGISQKSQLPVESKEHQLLLPNTPHVYRSQTTMKLRLLFKEWRGLFWTAYCSGFLLILWQQWNLITLGFWKNAKAARCGRFGVLLKI